MATYIISDIHGELKAFEKILKKINFSEDQDFLIVNGDVFDRGDHGVEILLMIKKLIEKGCATMLKGNHELFAERYMEGALTEREWCNFLGEGTLKGLKALDETKRNEIYDFIKQLPLYMKRDIPQFGKTVIVHTGLTEDSLVTGPDGTIDVIKSIESAKEKDEYGFLISADIHYWGRDRLSKLDKFIICGHVPTYQLGPEYIGKIFRTKAYMDIDAGAGYRDNGGKLACYCIDNGKEYYV